MKGGPAMNYEKPTLFGYAATTAIQEIGKNDEVEETAPLFSDPAYQVDE